MTGPTSPGFARGTTYDLEEDVLLLDLSKK